MPRRRRRSRRQARVFPSFIYCLKKCFEGIFRFKAARGCVRPRMTIIRRSGYDPGPMARISARTELFKILSVVATIPACFLLFYGGYTLLKYAGVLHAGPAVEFVVLPLVGGVCWFVLAAWAWSR